ncbi:MAG: glycerol-3-phosphate acyltransferase, partial [Ilumatobacteraceae bacterium]
MDVSTPTAILVTLVVGYLLGSIPVADLVARRRSGIDLRSVGDHNPGYWNAMETLGRRAALPVFIGDVVKGTVAALVGLAMANPGV